MSLPFGLTHPTSTVVRACTNVPPHPLIGCMVTWLYLTPNRKCLPVTTLPVTILPVTTMPVTILPVTTLPVTTLPVTLYIPILFFFLHAALFHLCYLPLLVFVLFLHTKLTLKFMHCAENLIVWSVIGDKHLTLYPCAVKEISCKPHPLCYFNSSSSYSFVCTWIFCSAMCFILYFDSSHHDIFDPWPANGSASQVSQPGSTKPPGAAPPPASTQVHGGPGSGGTRDAGRISPARRIIPDDRWQVSARHCCW